MSEKLCLGRVYREADCGVLNAVVLWNTTYIQPVLGHLQGLIEIGKYRNGGITNGNSILSAISGVDYLVYGSIKKLGVTSGKTIFGWRN